MTDKDSSSSDRTSSTVVITNVAPVLGTIFGPASGAVGEALTYSVPFSDAGTGDTHSCLISWGDSTSSTGTVSESPFGPPGSTSGASGTCTASHVYVGDGPYTIRFTLSDDHGGADTDTTTVTVNRSVFVLSPSVCGALTMTGNAVVDVQGHVAVNSNCSSAITANGNARLSAARISVVGGVNRSGNAILTPSPLTG